MHKLACATPRSAEAVTIELATVARQRLVLFNTADFGIGRFQSSPLLTSCTDGTDVAGTSAYMVRELHNSQAVLSFAPIVACSNRHVFRTGARGSSWQSDCKRRHLRIGYYHQRVLVRRGTFPRIF